MIDTTKTENSQKAKGSLNYSNRSKFILKEMDFNHLECLVLAQGNEDHHMLVRNVNMEWAQPLGFSLKMRRSPKEN
jgi:hypothetical protein